MERCARRKSLQVQNTEQIGSNTIQVKLTEQAGQPITGAEVTVTFFMPAIL